MKGIRIFIGVLATSIAFNAGATSPAECSKDPAAAFEEADAVVLAKILSTKIQPPTPPNYAVVEVEVNKYWKLRNKDIPRIIRMSTGEYNTRGMYVMFLKKYEKDADYYQLARCAPFAWVSERFNSNEIFKLLFLNTKEVYNVD